MFLKVAVYKVSYSDASTKDGPETCPLVFPPAIPVRADIYTTHGWGLVDGCTWILPPISPTTETDKFAYPKPPKGKRTIATTAQLCDWENGSG